MHPVRFDFFHLCGVLSREVPVSLGTLLEWHCGKRGRTKLSLPDCYV